MNCEKSFRERARELVAQMTLDEKISQMKYTAEAIEHLGIPAYNWWNECLHGVARAGTATSFPQAIAMAASFNDALMHEVATAISDEARAKYNQYKTFGDTEIYQGLTYWSPNINIFRDPRWGRGHETYGEDPYLTARMGTAFIKGLQGEGKYRKLDATIKHYAVHSGPEDLRHSFDTTVSEQDLYDTYLFAFRYCIEHASPSAVMGAYNRYAGEPCCGSWYLLQDILRDEFGFEGYVVSDCGAIRDFHANHKVTANAAESAAMAVRAGCDLNCGDVYTSLRLAVEQGLLDEETITESVERLFEARFRLGMFDDDCEYDNIPYDVVECPAHRDLARRMAQESMVLLKNDGILPLDADKRIAVIGPNADSVEVLLGNYHGRPSVYYTALRGIQQYTEPLYAMGCHLYEEKPNRDRINTSIREAVIAARHADVVVMCMGIAPCLEGEQGDAYNGASANGDKITLDLPISQRRLYEAVREVGKPIVFVNVSGSAVDLSKQKDECNAIVQCFYPGAMGGLALADVLFGKVSPSGRLPVTFYQSLDDLPDFTDYSMDNRTYKFYRGTPVYAFGYGLTYSDITEEWTNENTVVLHNSGDYDVDYSVLKYEYIPHKSLCDFKKVLVHAGERVTVTFEGGRR